MDYFAAMRAFVRAAELASFNQAARDLGVKTSTVSRCISDLERDLGIALFNRSTRGLVLTEGGRTFREHAVRALEAVDLARDATSALNDRPQGRLRVTLPVAYCRVHVAPRLPEFLARYPDISLEAIVTDETLNLIERGIDVAIRIGVLPDSGLMARRLAPHHRIVCASPGYLAGQVDPQTPADLARFECLGFSLRPGQRWTLVNTEDPGQRCDVPFGGRLDLNDSEALLEVVLAGFGVALLPSWLVSAYLQTGQLRQLLPAWEARSSEGTAAVWGVYPPKKTVSTKVRAFIDFFAGAEADPIAVVADSAR